MVAVWKEEVVIPTYEISEAEKSPMFLEKRVYQGSSGVVYPYPVVEKISDTAVNKTYTALFIENEYIKVMILPELGGRVQMAWDKISKRHFIYYNNVIKPALVGLTGPWISGGIEINWPQHHRPSTFLPVDYTIESLEDGGATVWVSERERMFHQKGMAGFTLRPGKAYLELRGQLFNPTPLPQTFLWWANPAVYVNDHYQSVFPPDVNAVYDHGRRDVSTFPIATGIYYKVDYSAGVDISRYKNIPVPTSYMAVSSRYDFVGGYENDTRAGMIHVADHHISPGKKQWTWGCGDFGKAWDRNLTDSDGPYIELMTGVYCDNQPDFSWLQPYEEKTFVQYFIPYRELGIIKNACRDVLLNYEPFDNFAILKLFATSRLEITLNITSGEGEIYSEEVVVSPENILERRIESVTRDTVYCIKVLNKNGLPLLCWDTSPEPDREVPMPAKPALQPDEIESNEQLFLTGHHIEQYRHATFLATDYYLEALRRDSSDIRCNNAMGLWLIRKGKFSEAETYLRKVIATLTERNPNPYDGEPWFNLGQSLKYQGKYSEAYGAFYKSCWNGAWQGAGYLELAMISTMNGDFDKALGELEMSLSRNWHNIIARHLKCALLRKTGRIIQAREVIDESLGQDRFNTGCLFEVWLISQNSSDLEAFLSITRKESHNLEELALDYLSAGLYDECIAVLKTAVKFCSFISPMVWYYMGYAQKMSGNCSEAEKSWINAAEVSPDYCFPNRLEAIIVLQEALKVNPDDPKACYYLGNIWYDKRQYTEAIECWENSVRIDDTFPVVLRNLSIARYNKQNRKADAVRLLEKAFEADTSNARILMELDQLYKRINRPHSERLSFLEEHIPLILQRDDLYLELCTLLNQTGRYREALNMITSRKFHPWEGGEGKVPAQYQLACTELAQMALEEQRYDEAINLLNRCLIYPENIGEGKLAGARENDFHYFLGCAWHGKGDDEKASMFFEKASTGTTDPTDAVYYNDQKPDKIYYQGLALKRLGQETEAEEIFKKLTDYGFRHISDEVRIDYFAVSLPDMLIWDYDPKQRNIIHCQYLIGLGLLGLGENEAAAEWLEKAFNSDNNHQGAQCHLKIIKKHN